MTSFKNALTVQSDVKSVQPPQLARNALRTYSVLLILQMALLLAQRTVLQQVTIREAKMRHVWRVWDLDAHFAHHQRYAGLAYPDGSEADRPASNNVLKGSIQPRISSSIGCAKTALKIAETANLQTHANNALQEKVL